MYRSLHSRCLEVICKKEWGVQKRHARGVGVLTQEAFENCFSPPLRQALPLAWCDSLAYSIHSFIHYFQAPAMQASFIEAHIS